MNTTIISQIEPLLTEEQTRIASLIHLTTAPLSIGGSGFIIYSIWKERKTKMRRVYQRLMLGLSIMDLISSLSLVLTMPWLAPSELGTKLVYAAYGNLTTCAISSFFYNFMQGASCYSVCLSLFFLTQVKFEMREEKFSKCLEPFSHAFSILVPVVSGILGAIGGDLNPITAMPGLCYIQELPTGCNSNEELDCIRGEKAEGTNFLIGMVTAASFAIIVICMFLIICKVAATEQKIRKYGQGTQTSMIRTKQTGRQALMYIGAYFSWFFPFVPVNLLQANAQYGDKKYFIALLALRTISPLQGFFNALIYRKRMGGAERPRSSVAHSRASASRLSVAKLRPSKFFSKASNESQMSSAHLIANSSNEPEMSASLRKNERSVQHENDNGDDDETDLRHSRIDMTGSIDGSLKHDGNVMTVMTESDDDEPKEEESTDK